MWALKKVILMILIPIRLTGVGHQSKKRQIVFDICYVKTWRKRINKLENKQFDSQLLLVSTLRSVILKFIQPKRQATIYIVESWDLNTKHDTDNYASNCRVARKNFVKDDHKKNRHRDGNGKADDDGERKKVSKEAI